ncbi:MAG: hypothetical protein D6712_21090, partial [Chloroflexi bacterium]
DLKAELEEFVKKDREFRTTEILADNTFLFTVTTYSVADLSGECNAESGDNPTIIADIVTQLLNDVMDFEEKIEKLNK